jgi:hypothetical protein
MTSQLASELLVEEWVRFPLPCKFEMNNGLTETVIVGAGVA